MRTSSLLCVLALNLFTLAVPSPVAESDVSHNANDTPILEARRPALRSLSQRPSTPYLFSIDEEVPLFINFTRYGRLIHGAYGSRFMYARFSSHRFPGSRVAYLTLMLPLRALKGTIHQPAPRGHWQLWSPHEGHAANLGDGPLPLHAAIGHRGGQHRDGRSAEVDRGTIEIHGCIRVRYF